MQNLNGICIMNTSSNFCTALPGIENNQNGNFPLLTLNKSGSLPHGTPLTALPVYSLLITFAQVVTEKFIPVNVQMLFSRFIHTIFEVCSVHICWLLWNNFNNYWKCRILNNIASQFLIKCTNNSRNSNIKKSFDLL